MQKIINVGCGNKCFSCADNLDPKVKHPDVIEGDAHKLNYSDKEVDVVIMVSPYGYYPLKSDAKRILKPEGLLVVVGTYSNRYFKSVWKAGKEELENIGYQVVSKTSPPHEDLQESYLSDGETQIDVYALCQIVLRRLP